MRFWDASAIAPLLVREAATRRMQELAESDPGIRPSGHSEKQDAVFRFIMTCDTADFAAARCPKALDDTQLQVPRLL